MFYCVSSASMESFYFDTIVGITIRPYDTSCHLCGSLVAINWIFVCDLKRTNNTIVKIIMRITQNASKYLLTKKNCLTSVIPKLYRHPLISPSTQIFIYEWGGVVSGTSKYYILLIKPRCFCGLQVELAGEFPKTTVLWFEKFWLVPF